MYHIDTTAPSNWSLRLLVLVGGCVLAVVVWALWLQPAQTVSPVARIHFLDVGQGDAILIESPSGTRVLLDGGPDAGIVRELAGLLPFFNPTLHLVIATHYDSDHVGGLLPVLKKYRIQKFAAPIIRSDIAIAKSLLSQLDAAFIPRHETRAGYVYDLGGGLRLEILSPSVVDTKLPRNSMSVVARVSYGNTSFLLTGDAPKAVEEYLVLRYGEYLESDVLKVGHHGSRTSTSQLFLETVAPELAIISAGQDNSYGHPHTEVTDSLFNAGVEILTTATAGTITLVSDGEQLWVE